MPAPPLLKPNVYSAESTSSLPDHPALKGGRCICDHVFFPMQHYGCEKCGRHGEALRPALLAGRGRLIASARVHLHAGRRPAPFTIGTIVLDDGPLVRTLLAEPAVDLASGRTMITVLVAIRDPETGESRLDLRFRPEGETA